MALTDWCRDRRFAKIEAAKETFPLILASEGTTRVLSYRQRDGSDIATRSTRLKVGSETLRSRELRMDLRWFARTKTDIDTREFAIGNPQVDSKTDVVAQVAQVDIGR